jgi:hypothetical protein
VYYLNARNLILSYLMPVGWFFSLANQSIFKRPRCGPHARPLFLSVDFRTVQQFGKELVADCEAEGEAAAGTSHGIRFQSDAPTSIPTVGDSGNSSGIGAPGPDLPGGFGDPLGGLV